MPSELAALRALEQVLRGPYAWEPGLDTPVIEALAAVEAARAADEIPTNLFDALLRCRDKWEQAERRAARYEAALALLRECREWIDTRSALGKMLQGMAITHVQRMEILERIDATLAGEEP